MKCGGSGKLASSLNPFGFGPKTPEEKPGRGFSEILKRGAQPHPSWTFHHPFPLGSPFACSLFCQVLSHHGAPQICFSAFPHHDLRGPVGAERDPQARASPQHLHRGRWPCPCAPYGCLFLHKVSGIATCSSEVCIYSPALIYTPALKWGYDHPSKLPAEPAHVEENEGMSTMAISMGLEPFSFNFLSNN